MISLLNSFPCVKCGGYTAVVDSRPTTYRGAHSIRRRRRCKQCGYRVSTFEVVDEDDNFIDRRLPKVIAAARDVRLALTNLIERFDGEEHGREQKTPA